MTLEQLGYSAVTGNSINHWNSSWNKHLLRLDTIYVLYDNDKAGKQASAQTVKRMLGRGRLVIWPSMMEEKEDINSLLMKYGPDFTKSFIENILVRFSIEEGLLDIDNVAERIMLVNAAARKVLSSR
jgi:DNA primase